MIKETTVPAPEFIDDELVITVRIRLGGPDIAEHISEAVLTNLPGRLHLAVKDLLRPGDADLAGIEIALPDFRPYNAAGKVTHVFSDGRAGPEVERGVAG